MCAYSKNMLKRIILLLFVCVNIHTVYSHEKIIHKVDSQHGSLEHKHIFYNNHHQTLHSRNNVPQNITPLDLIYNEISQFLVLINNATNSLSLFDSKSNLVLLKNNNSAFIIDAMKNTIYQIKPIENIENILKQPTLLQDLIKSGQVLPSAKLNKILKQFGLNPNILDTISKSLKQLSHLNLLNSLFSKSNRFTLPNGFLKFGSVLNGLVSILRPIGNNATAVLKDNPLNLPAVLGTNSGVEALIKIIESLVSHANPLANLQRFLENIENVLEIIVKLAGNTSGCAIDGIMRIIYNIQLLVTGRESIEDFIKVIMDVAHNAVNTGINNIKTIIEQLGKIVRRCGVLSNLLKLLENIENNNLNMGGVDVGKLLQMIKNGDYQNAVGLVENLFSQLGNVLQHSNGIGNILQPIVNPSETLADSSGENIAEDVTDSSVNTETNPSNVDLEENITPTPPQEKYIKSRKHFKHSKSVRKIHAVHEKQHHWNTHHNT